MRNRFQFGRIFPILISILFAISFVATLFAFSTGSLFTETVIKSGFDGAGGVTAGDLDNDGDTDMLIHNNAGPLRVLLNQVGQKNAWPWFSRNGAANTTTNETAPTSLRRYCIKYDIRNIQSGP